jgi:hypothetical protein
MATSSERNERISRWLEAEAPGRLPDRVLQSTFEQTRRSGQQAGWRALLDRLHMPRFSVVLGGAAAAVLVVATVGFQVLPAIVGPDRSGGTASPSATLIARGSFVEHDWGQVDFEATRAGSSVTGRLTIAGRDGWGPITADLQCAFETEDGRVMIGGFITLENQIWGAGEPFGVVLDRGSPHRAIVRGGHAPATEYTDCLAIADAWLRHIGGVSRVLRGSVEFGP